MLVFVTSKYNGVASMLLENRVSGGQPVYPKSIHPILTYAALCVAVVVGGMEGRLYPPH